MEVTAGFEPADNGVADRGLTTWLRHQNFDCLNIIAELSRFVKSFFILFFLFFFTIVNYEKICYNIDENKSNCKKGKRYGYNQIYFSIYARP